MAGHLSVALLVQGTLLGTAGSVVSLVLLALNIKLRNARLIKMSSPYLNVVMAIGAVILNACCLMYGLDYFTMTRRSMATVVCRVRVSSLVCGFTLVHAPMLAKAWRIHRIFQKATLQRVAIRDNQLLAVTALLLAADVIILGLWHGLDPIEFTAVTFESEADPPTSNLSFPRNDVISIGCTSAHAHAWVAGIYAMKTIMLLYGLLLAWRIRNVMLPSMSDAKCIIVCSLATAILASFTTAVAILLEAWPNAVYACVIGAIWISTTVVLYQVFITKMVLWWKNPDGGDFRVSGRGRLTTIQSFEELEEELFAVLSENRALKQSLEERSRGLVHQVAVQTPAETEARQDSGLDISSSGEGEGDDDATSPARLDQSPPRPYETGSNNANNNNNNNGSSNSNIRTCNINHNVMNKNSNFNIGGSNNNYNGKMGNNNNNMYSNKADNDSVTTSGHVYANDNIPGANPMQKNCNAPSADSEHQVRKGFTVNANGCFDGSRSEIFIDAECKQHTAPHDPSECDLHNLCMLHPALSNPDDIMRYFGITDVRCSSRGNSCRNHCVDASDLPWQKRRDSSAALYQVTRRHSKVKRSCQGYGGRRRSSGATSVTSGGFNNLDPDPDTSSCGKRRRFSLKTFAALSREVSQCSKRRSLLYDSFRSKRDVSAAIARSYNLEDNEDTYSYVSSYLPCTTSSVFKTEMMERCRDRRRNFDDSFSTLANDRMYPDFMPKSSTRKKHKRKAGRSREPIRGTCSYDVRNGTANRSVFTIPERCEFLGFRGIGTFGNDTFV